MVPTLPGSPMKLHRPASMEPLSKSSQVKRLPAVHGPATVVDPPDPPVLGPAPEPPLD
jgi:hypothetical protein